MPLADSSISPVAPHAVTGRSGKSGPRRCIACGSSDMGRGRRYCSPRCRQHINWVLSLSKGLLQTFNARYASFFFTEDHVFLDVLPAWSSGISRFMCHRSPAKKPADDLKRLVLNYGNEWYELLENKHSRSSASLYLLKQNHAREVDPKSVKPGRKASVRLTKRENDCMKILKLSRKDLNTSGQVVRIKSAYKRMAKRYHPDMGGDDEKFKKLNEAHRQMLIWSENPQFTSRKALEECWSYDGTTNRWSPPL